MIRVVIAEDHTMVREALVWLFRRSKKIEVVGEAGTGSTAVELTMRLRPDVLVLDLTMPEKDGLQVMSELAQFHAATRILVLTMHDDEAHGVRALRAGATGFLTKATPAAGLIAAIEKVHKGEKVASPELLAALTRKGGADDPAQLLSPREFQILTYLARGKNHHEIAEALSISVKTVDTHRAHILGKLALRNNSDLTRYAIANGLMAV